MIYFWVNLFARKGWLVPMLVKNELNLLAINSYLLQYYLHF